MKIHNRKISVILFVLFLMASHSSLTNAAHFTFRQGGFKGGGVVTGSFVAEDYGHNYGYYMPPDGFICVQNPAYGDCYLGRGYILSDYTELKSFSIHFSGNPRFESFNNFDDIKNANKIDNYNFPTGMFSFIYYVNSKSLALILSAQGLSCCSGDTEYFEYRSNLGDSISIYVDNQLEIYSTNEPLIVSQVPLPGAFVLFIAGFFCLIGKIRHKAVG